MGTRYTIEGNVPKGQVVNPSSPKNGGIKQPRYTRGSANHQTSKRLKQYQSCIAEKMSGQSGSRSDIREAFRQAANSC